MRYLFVILLLSSFTVSAQSHFGSKSFNKPTLSPTTVVAQSETQANVESYVLSNGGAEIIAYRILFDDVNPPIDTLVYSPDFNIIISWTPVSIWNAKTGLTPGTTYYTKVCASNVAGETCTNVVSVTMPSTPIVLPSVTTNNATSVGLTSATLNGNVTNDGGGTISDRGFYYSTTYPPTSNSVSSGTGTGAYSSNLTSLESATTYYFRAYAVNETGESLGDILSFTTTTPSGLASVTTTTPHTVLVNSAISGGDVIHDGNSAITARGICYSRNTGVDIADSLIYSGVGIGVYALLIPNLTHNTTYYVRAFAINGNGVAYGDELSFTTANNSVLATVTTTTASGITTGSANLGGNVTSDGGSTVTARGVCYSTSPNPTTGSPGGTGTGVFSVTASYLTPGTTYYYRAYATNINGTAYGNEYSFTTLIPLSAPVLTTLSAVDITETTAIAGGSISYDGNSAIYERGVCWSTSANPTTANDKATSGATSGSFYTFLSGLSPSTTYHIRAYAINAVGTGYGNDLTFTTGSIVSIPTVTTSSATSITEISAVLGGNVTSDGGASVTDRGVVINTTGNPSLYSYTIAKPIGSGTGAYSGTVSTLSPATTYYVRAYATNSQGTAYGNEVTFTTSEVSYPCEGNIVYPGGQSYPTEIIVDLGTEIGTSTVHFDAKQVPDYCIVYFSGSVVADIGYRGHSMYDYGGSNRDVFRMNLNGKSDPRGIYTYPDMTRHPEDGYPRITTGTVSVRFFKSNISRYATVYIFAPIPSTVWNVSISCPE